MTDFNIIVGVQSGDALRDLSKVQNGVKRVGQETKRTSQHLKNHANQYNKTAVSTNKWAKGALQQAGYQVGDFAVQVGNGTSALQAFGQQGSQLLGIFGPVGAVLGAAVAIVSAVGVAFIKSSGSVKSMREELDEASSSMEALRGNLEMGFAPLSEINKRFGSFAIRVKEMSEAQRQLNFSKTAAEIIDATEALKEFVEPGFFERLFSMEFGPQDIGVAARKLQDDLKITKKEAFEVAKGFSAIGRAKGIEEKADAILSLQKALTLVTPAGHEGEKAIAELGEQLSSGALLAYEYLAALEALERGGFPKDDKPPKTIETARKEIMKLTPHMEEMKKLANDIGQTFESSFMSVVKGSKSVKDAFRSLASDIISELYRVFVVKQITGFITDVAGFALGARPAPGSSASIIGKRASGGPVSAGKPYIVGERGPELMIPGSSGTVVPNSRLGGGGVTVNQTINVTTGVQQTVRTEIKSLMPQIAESAKAAVVDAKRRGGSYGRSFA